FSTPPILPLGSPPSTPPTTPTPLLLATGASSIVLTGLSGMRWGIRSAPSLNCENDRFLCGTTPPKVGGGGGGGGGGPTTLTAHCTRGITCGNKSGAISAHPITIT